MEQINNGSLTSDFFSELCSTELDNTDGKNFLSCFENLTPDLTKNYLLALGLAVEIDHDKSGTLFIPSLVTNEQKEDKLYMNNYQIEQFKVTLPHVSFSNFHEIMKILQKDSTNIEVEDIFYEHLGRFL